MKPKMPAKQAAKRTLSDRTLLGAIGWERLELEGARGSQ